jgi:cytochrome c5
MLALLIGLALSGFAQERTSTVNASVSPSTSGTAASATAASHPSAFPAKKMEGDPEERTLRLEGEKRFRANCGRCHMAPHKFPPRVMATAIRHMRVRALITDEDMRLIRLYMTQ